MCRGTEGLHVSALGTGRRGCKVPIGINNFWRAKVFYGVLQSVIPLAKCRPHTFTVKEDTVEPPIIETIGTANFFIIRRFSLVRVHMYCSGIHRNN